MKIIEDITYDLDDIISQIKEAFGFIYTRIDDTSGYIVMGSSLKLILKFNDSENKLDSATLNFLNDVVDLTNSTTMADIYAAGIESSIQIVDLVHRMLSEKKGTVND